MDPLAPNRKEATYMAPESGSTSFAVTHPVHDRYSRRRPVGRVVASAEGGEV